MPFATYRARLRHCFWLAVLLGITAWLGFPLRSGAQTPDAAHLETFPDYVYGASAIAPGQSYTSVTGRFITPSSLILIPPDTTGLPDTATPVSGLKVISRYEGGFDVITRSRGVTGSSGAPFNWIVF